MDDYRDALKHTTELETKLAQGAEAPPATTSHQILERIDDDVLAALLKDAGYEDIERKQANIYGATLKGKLKVLVLTDGEAIQIAAGFGGYSLSAGAMNAWNQKRRFSRAYLDKEGDPVIEADVSLEGGVSRRSLIAFLETYQITLADFTRALIKSSST